MQSKVEELEEINQSLRNCDKLKDDPIYNYQISLSHYPQDYRKLKEDNTY